MTRNGRGPDRQYHRRMPLAEDYLAALESGDPRRVLELFAPDAIVHSPLYGDLLALDFYPRLFADTGDSKLTLRTVFHAEKSIAFWFDFDWTLSNGTPAPFRVVDIAEVDDDGRISELHIVYDTANVREAFDALRP